MSDRREARASALPALPVLTALLLAAGSPGAAQALPLLDGETLRLDLNGDVKGFFYQGLGYEPDVTPELLPFVEGQDLEVGDFGLGAFDLRLKLQGAVSSWLRFEVHHVLTAAVTQTPEPLGVPGEEASPQLATGLFSPGAAAGELPQAIDLSWRADDRDVAGRLDRLALAFRLPGFDLTLGRQPVTFGSTYFFTPMDLVAPFSPFDVDREYKPGIDAVRADAYFGTATKITAVAAYAGAWDLDGLVLAAHGQTTIDVWDLGLFLASAHADWVVGANTAGSLGPVAVRGEATLTFPEGDRGAPFVRAVLGADHRFESTLVLSGEVYVQSLGPADPAGYLTFAQGERFIRGELWALGRWYAAVSASYELVPILTVNAFAMVNLRDPSALLGPGLTWSVADEAEVVAGAYVGLGERPTVGLDLATLAPEVTAGSEFGLVPVTAYAVLKTYF